MLKLKTAILAAALIFGVFAVIPYAQQTTTAPATAPQEPTVDFPSPDEKPPVFLTSEQEKRRAKSAIYDRPKSLPIKETPGMTYIPLSDHWWLRLPALPVAQSDAVVLGVIADCHAFFSNDRHVVYSEFSLEPEQILKDDTNSVSLGFPVTTTRLGGVVRFPSGRTQTYHRLKQSWPIPGRRYVLFLRRNEAGDFDIVTGYEFRDGTAQPLDGTPGIKTEHELRKYEGTSEAALLELIKTAIANSPGEHQ